ncbi:SsrA-binding protein SmpB [Candidatus Parcubacteria bacterium]|nr:SsrA-binding protein SmpB [Candidatus Parcubacteria bacterium]
MPILAKNRKALYDYEILEKIEAGVVLSGAEVKSAKAGRINLKGSHVSFIEDEPFLFSAHISRYKPAAARQKFYNPDQKRKLLLNRKQIDHLRGKIESQGLTIVPILVYTNRNLIKVEIALVRGKRKYEKREIIKKRDIDRRLRERMKR